MVIAMACVDRGSETLRRRFFEIRNFRGTVRLHRITLGENQRSFIGATLLLEVRADYFHQLVGGACVGRLRFRSAKGV